MKSGKIFWVVTRPSSTWWNQNFAATVTGHRGWQIDWFSTVCNVYACDVESILPPSWALLPAHPQMENILECLPLFSMIYAVLWVLVLFLLRPQNCARKWLCNLRTLNSHHVDSTWRHRACANFWWQKFLFWCKCPRIKVLSWENQ